MTYLDGGLTNGVAYYYVVVAVDLYGNESTYSNEAMGIPSDQIAAEKPELFFPTLSGFPAARYKFRTDISGTAEPGSEVQLFKNGTSAHKTNASESDVVQTYSVSGGGYSLSPDGKTLAYTSGGSIWLKTLSTGQTNVLIEEASAPVWSPDGSLLAYRYRDNSSKYRIGIYDIETGDKAALTEEANISENRPSWSFDGGQVALLRDEGSGWNVWVTNRSTGSLTQVTSNGASDARLSPDGKKIAYFGPDGLSYVNLVNGDEINLDPQAENYSFDWSPDNQRLVFVSWRTGNANLFVWSVETGSQNQITDSTAYETDPRWSPNGKEILFSVEEETLSIALTSWDGQGTRIIQKDIDQLGYLVWAKSGGIASIDQNQLSLLHLKGHFTFENIELEIGENIFHAIAVDPSGNGSFPSDQISVVFNTTYMPDLQVTPGDIFIYPSSPVEGDGTILYVFVQNKGQAEVKDVDVEIYLWDATGKLERLKSETIPSMNPVSEQVLSVQWNTAGKVGSNQVIVNLDPEDRIHESHETNNFATREFFVAKEAGISMTTTLDGSEYPADQNVNIEIRLRNSGPERDVVIEVWIEDETGATVTHLEPIPTHLAYASEENYSLVWNTGVTYAGAYRIRAAVKGSPEVITENIVPFIILRDIQIDLTLATDKTHYDPNETVLTHLTVKNTGQNYVLPQLGIKLGIFDLQNRDLYTENREIKNLLPGGITQLASSWNTGLYPPADYRAQVELSLDGQIVSNKSVTFKINPSTLISGHLTVTPRIVLLGNTVQADYTVQNSGNADITGMTLKLTVLDPDTQVILSSYEEIVDLPINQARSGQSNFSTQGYGLKTYAVHFGYTYQEKQKTIATTSFTVKDGFAPTVSVLSPISDKYYNSRIEIAAFATDDASGIEKVEYRIDGGPWRPLPVSDPAQGRYSTFWDPTVSDEGKRTISLMATDRAGNISPPVSVEITIDLTPPAAPLIVSPPNNSTLSTEVVEIRGMAEPGSMVEMTFVNVFSTQANPSTGEFIFGDVKLLPGENKATFQAKDAAGNVSLPAEYTIHLFKPTLEAKKTIPDVRNLLVWVNEKCKEVDGIKVHCNDEDRECIQMDLLERIISQATDSYLIVDDREDIEKVKAPYYTDLLILGDQNPLTDHYGDELRELVHSGKGLISSLYLKHAGCPKDEFLFGLEYRGHLPGDEHEVYFLKSPISDEMTLEARGDALRVNVDDPTRVAAWMKESNGPHCDPEPRQYPAVVLNEYGLGKTVFFAFDLGMTFSDETYDQISTFLKNAISYVHRPLDTTTFYPVQVVPVEIEVKSLGGAMDVRISETYPPEIKLYDPGAGKWVLENPWVQDIRLAPDERKILLYYALTPDQAGIYTLQTEVGTLDNGNTSPHETLSTEIVLQKDSAAMLEDILKTLKSLSVREKDRSELRDAIEHMEKVQKRVVKKTSDIKKNIDDLLEAIDALLDIRSADISEIRLMIDRLFVVWLGKLILLPQP
jgi:Tol biopolymer transport system component